MRNFFFLLLALATPIYSHIPFPIQFSISETKVIDEVPEKTQDFATVIPGQGYTYIFNYEANYYNDYQKSYYAVTTKKGGWDCLRHYEILANGCIPYFLDLDACDTNTMAFLPKELIKEAMQLEGVSYLHIDHSKFNKARYLEILKELLEHTKQYLTSKQMAKYLLEKMNYSGEGKILFLSRDVSPDYLRCLTLIGLKELLGDKLVDVPKIPHIYKSFPGDISKLYGKGISYTKILEDLFVNRENMVERIKQNEFELVIYGSVHRGLLYHDLVQLSYPKEKIAYLCGEDFHQCQYSHWTNLFLREYSAYVR